MNTVTTFLSQLYFQMQNLEKENTYMPLFQISPHTYTYLHNIPKGCPSFFIYLDKFKKCNLRLKIPLNIIIIAENTS